MVACQSPTVHIYSRDLSQLERSRVQSLFETENIHFKFTNLQSPDHYHEPYLLYHPQDSDQALISAVERVVREVGFNRLNTQVFNKKNHYYTQGNMGLYFPAKNSHSVELPELLFTHQCTTTDMQIHIKQNGKWMARNQTDLQGKWQYVEPYLTLHWFDGSGMVQQAYQGRIHTVPTKLGPRNAVTFTVLGHRSYPLALLNCDLQAIFM
ncbi:hypothetical protein BIW53_09425 [Pseudoalteromonas byunsanensis]|uniref:Uncharacterized protein n=2 Tax=Pseudoalteromonas byunsanensis TaxID=327939 RepID=A0A1S1N467_9GAMM|nr:hypothetical protein BIW53_09425 [Pseudoalteromonas byunsanensis]